MRQLILFTIICASAATAGCGGSGLSQADMRRQAIHRPSTDNNDSPSATRSLPTGSQGDLDADVEVPRQQRVTAATSGQASEATGTPAAPPSSQPPPAPTSPNATRANVAIQDAAANAITSPSATTNPRLGPEPPSEPLSPEQRRQRTIDNLTQIGAAIRRFGDQNGRLFGPAICNARQQPVLSWRVELLPDLG